MQKKCKPTLQGSYRRFISLLLAVIMVINVTVFTNNNGAYAAVSLPKANEAISKFADAITKLSTKFAENSSQIANFCTRLGGVTSAVSGVIGILQMAGIIQDSTAAALGQILDTVKDMQSQLDNMNKTLNDIVQSLISIQTAQQEIARNEKATAMSTSWNNFNTNYTEKLNDKVKEYEAKINEGIKKWWENSSHEGVYVLFTKKYTEENSLTYSKKSYSEGLPEKSDINDEIVNKEWSIGIPSEYMPNTSAVKFNIDTYRSDFKKLAVTALENALKANGLASACGASFKSSYNTAMLESYANNLLNTVIYHTACDVMSANNSWVVEVTNLYRNYCANIMQRDSGVNAFLNYIFLTHAFEGEVKSDIEKFCDSMTAQAGFYGEFALTCVGQDNMQSKANKEEIQTLFINTVISLADRKSKALTGFNNYCYITGTRLRADTLDIISSIYVNKSEVDTYSGCKIQSWQTWEAMIPNIINSIYLPIIYKQYTKLPQGAKTFAEYLNKYEVQYSTGNKLFLTNYRGQQNFAFNEGIKMQAHKLVNNAKYFKDEDWYNIDTGINSKVEQKYYHVHDKVMGDWFDSNNGSLSANQIIAARALYGESHTLWINDEIFAFASENVTYSFRDGYGYDKNVTFTRIVDILKSIIYHEKGGEDDADDPFWAFDAISLFSELFDDIEPSYQTISKDITEVLLEGESFPYTGQPIEPAVMVLASDDVLSEDCYTVDYMDNIEAGKNAMVIVEGVGDYTGIIAQYFTIVSADSSSNSSSELNVYGSSSGGCNAMSSMFIALGLGFIAMTNRKRK